jgi:bifunctional non-homologous end joining protein LigD
MASSSDYVPQLATLVRSPPAGDEWLHEIKFDGYRIGCHVGDGRVRLISRNGKDWTDAFPEIAEAAGRLRTRDALLDGEVVVLLPDGRTSFEALQQAARSGTGRAALVYFAFDLLRLDGERLASLPLEARKARLRRLLGRRTDGRLRYTDHVDGQGDAFLREASRLGLEGIVSKRRDLPSLPGRRDSWRKTKCLRQSAFVIGGYVDSPAAHAGLGALLVGRYEGRRLLYAGRVGTGFSRALAGELRGVLDSLARPDSPFHAPPEGAPVRRARWVAPTLVCDVAFTEWTSAGVLRHPAFRGLRRDVRPRDVTGGVERG